MRSFSALIGRVADGHELAADEARHAFDRMADGDVTPAQMAGFLLALRTRGETVTEIAAAVTAMRARMVAVRAPADAMDVVGTGGDGSGSFNISTATAFVVAAAGVPVAKHGNRALSSRCGAADVLLALGVRIDLTPDGVARCVEEAGIGFMFAPAHHPALRHVGPTRVELATRTVFNLLGPMLNPAGVRRHLIGTYSARWLQPVAEVLRELGSESAWIVHAHDGLDEISTTAPTRVARLRRGAVDLLEISPEDAGVRRRSPEELRGGDAEANAVALRAVLAGEPGAYRDTVVLNTAAALLVAGEAHDLRDGADRAAALLDGGAAAERLDQLCATSHQVDAVLT